MKSEIEIRLNHAWRYFELHANQRISLVRFYVGLYSLYISASGYIIFHDDSFANGDRNIVLILSVLFLVITLIFYLLDQRNRDLIHFAEASLRRYEFDMGLKEPHNIFVIEERDALKKSKFRHSHCFNTLFLIGALSAVIVFMFAKYAFGI